MRRTRAAAALILVGSLAASAASADESGTRLGLMFGRSEQVGELGSRYDLGWTFGIEAGWIPTWAGFVWSVSYTYYAASDARDPVQKLTLWDFGMSLRARAPLRRIGLPIFGYGQIGVAILRASTALPPDASDTFVGPKGALGIEAAWGSIFLGFEADYSLLTGGPSGLSLLARIGFGQF
jgi:hypothetical protein